MAGSAIDLAKNVLQLAFADASFRILRSLRLKRSEFLAFWANHAVVHVVREAHGSAPHFGRLIKGARSVPVAAKRKQQADKPRDALRQWAITLADRRGFNNAAVCLANTTLRDVGSAATRRERVRQVARIIWATWKHDRAFDGNHVPGKNLQPA